MNTEINGDHLFKRLIENFGQFHQLGIVQEECAELTVAISKFMRDPSDETAKQMLAEMVDVKIMLEQLSMILEAELGVKYAQSLFDKERFKQLERIKVLLDE